MSKLVFNLDEGTLLGYRVGQHAGDPDGRRVFYDSGYAVNIAGQRVSSILAVFRSGYEGFSPFTGTVVLNETPFQFTTKTTSDEFRSAFGKPQKSWSDGVERCEEFNAGLYRIEVIWHIDGTESRVYISIEFAWNE